MKIIKFLIITMMVVFFLGCNEKELLKTDSENAFVKNVNFENAQYFPIFNTPQPPFPVNDPDVSSFFPRSESGHVSSSPFYLHSEKVNNNIEGLCWWFPLKEDIGVYHIVFKACDSNGACTEQICTITVIEGDNYPPTILVNYEKGETNVHNKS